MSLQFFRDFGISCCFEFSKEHTPIAWDKEQQLLSKCDFVLQNHFSSLHPSNAPVHHVDSCGGNRRSFSWRCFSLRNFFPWRYCLSKVSIIFLKKMFFKQLVFLGFGGEICYTFKICIQKRRYVLIGHGHLVVICSSLHLPLLSCFSMLSKAGGIHAIVNYFNNYSAFQKSEVRWEAFKSVARFLYDLKLIYTHYQQIWNEVWCDCASVFDRLSGILGENRTILNWNAFWHFDVQKRW